MKKISVSVLVLMSLMLLAMGPVMVQGYGEPESMVRAVGQFTSSYDFGTDHRCFINLHARQTADEWTGRGFFWDKDYADGKLIVIFNVELAFFIDLPSQIVCMGSSDVYINDVFAGNYGWSSTMLHTDSWEAFNFLIPGLEYNAFVFGADIGINMNVKY